MEVDARGRTPRSHTEAKGAAMDSAPDCESGGTGERIDATTTHWSFKPYGIAARQDQLDHLSRRRMVPAVCL